MLGEQGTECTGSDAERDKRDHEAEVEHRCVQEESGAPGRTVVAKKPGSRRRPARAEQREGPAEEGGQD